MIAKDSNIHIGAQCHFGAVEPQRHQMNKISEGMDYFATLGKKIAITEYHAPSRSKNNPDPNAWQMTPEEQAAWSANFHILAFSKPYITQIVRWYDVDGRNGMYIDGGIFFADGATRKPEYEALQNLFKRKWVSQWNGSLTAKGEALFRGFYGTYEVVVAGYEKTRVELKSTTAKEVTLQLKPMKHSSGHQKNVTDQITQNSWMEKIKNWFK
jgi:hypothetical protein